MIGNVWFKLISHPTSVGQLHFRGGAVRGATALSRRCTSQSSYISILGDIWLWVGVPWASSALVVPLPEIFREYNCLRSQRPRSSVSFYSWEHTLIPKPTNFRSTSLYTYVHTTLYTCHTTLYTYLTIVYLTTGPARASQEQNGPDRSSSSFLILSSLELSNTKEPQIGALLGTASHFCEVVVLKSRSVPNRINQIVSQATISCCRVFLRNTIFHRW